MGGWPRDFQQIVCLLMCTRLCVCGCVLVSGIKVLHYHFLCLAEIDIFLALTPRLALLNVHETDEWHGPAPKEEDGEEHDDDGGGAD